MRLLPLKIAPLAGSWIDGSSSNGTKPCQSYFAIQPGTGTRPSASFAGSRIGRRTGAMNPTCPSRSAKTMFWCGAWKSRSDSMNSARSRARFMRKPERAVALSSRSAAHASAKTCPFGATSPADFTTSEITGPWRVERTRMRRSSLPTRITSSRTWKASRPVGVR